MEHVLQGQREAPKERSEKTAEVSVQTLKAFIQDLDGPDMTCFTNAWLLQHF